LNRRWLRRLLMAAGTLLGLLALAIAIAAASSWRCRLQGAIHPPAAQPQKRRALTSSISGYTRPEDETFLSYPEWYIVWSYEEKADFQRDHLPSSFSYFGAVAQYWNSYCCISRLARGKYGFNPGEQVMLVVIGSSFSAEYILKGAYENTIGRFSEWSSHHQPVEEDRYAASVARDYADFVHVRPFYEFHFANRIEGVWSATRWWGAHPLRKWERKLFLTLDYTVEAFYCWVIEKLTHLTYGHEPAETYAWVESADERFLRQLSHVRVVRQAYSGAFILAMPRYQEFTAVAARLAERNAHFVEIAGNSQIILSVLAPQTWRYNNRYGKELFAAPLLTRPDKQRVVLGCEVRALDQLLLSLRSEPVIIEHVYDY